MKTAKLNWKQRISLLSLLFLLSSFAVDVFAASSQKSSGKKSKAKVTRTAKKTKKTPPPAPVIDEATVHSSFETFTQDWMKKLVGTEDFHRKEHLKVSQNGETFSAEYVGYLPQRFIEVKKTTSQETPFIGTLTYYERRLRCTGKTKEAAIQGPFEQVETTPVKEIFRFSKGQWRY